eukprot:340548-Prymnesium_polylepis.1
MAAQYEQANNVLLPGEPDWAPERDPLYGQPMRQQQRTAAVAAVWGANSDVWSDILHNSGIQQKSERAPARPHACCGKSHN